MSWFKKKKIGEDTGSKDKKKKRLKVLKLKQKYKDYSEVKEKPTGTGGELFWAWSIYKVVVVY